MLKFFKRKGFRLDKEDPIHIEWGLLFLYGSLKYYYRDVVQLVRMSGLGPDGRQFESDYPDNYLRMSELVEAASLGHW